MTSRFVLPFADVGSGIKPSSGAKLFFFETGTSTPKDTYSDSGGLTPNTNPVIANSNGLFGDIFISGVYKVILQDKNGTQIWEVDPIDELASFQDLTLVYEFDTVALMTASTIAFPVNKKISTKGYHSVGDGGQAEYIVTSGITPNIGSPTLTAGLYAEVQNQERVNVNQWGAVADGVGGTDNTAVFEACRDYCISNLVTLHVPDGVFWFVGDLDLWGVNKIKVTGIIAFTNLADRVVVGGSTVSAPAIDIDIHECTGTIQVHGMNRGNLKVIQTNTIHLLATDELIYNDTRRSVAYNRFEWVNVDNLILECQDTQGGVPWMNENKYYGGKIRASFVTKGTYPLNNNIFYGVTLESMLVDMQVGHDNIFHDVRLESAANPNNMKFQFAATTFNNLFYQTWGNFANTSIWGFPVQSTLTIADLGDNNRIVSAHMAYLDKDSSLLIDRENLDDNGTFGINAINTDEIEVLTANAIVFDTGVIPVTDKLWFSIRTDISAFHTYLEVYDADGVPITIEPVAGFKTSNGTTTWNAAGYWWYATPIIGGDFAVNPIKDPNVKYVRFWSRTDSGPSGATGTRVEGFVTQAQESKIKIKNLAADNLYNVDITSNRVDTTLETDALDLFKFTSTTTTSSFSSSVIAAELEIAVNARNGASLDAASAKLSVIITKEGNGVMLITASAPVILSNGGTLQINNVVIGTKAGASVSEAIMTINIETNQADPHTELAARARLTGVSNYGGSITYLIDVDKI